MDSKNVARVDQVEPGSLAEKLGIKAGDVLLEINGHPIQDIIDYKFRSTDEFLELGLLRSSGRRELLKVCKEYDEDLGLRFTTAVFDGIKRCRNRCVFCFIDQLPSHLREGLYIKDDDYRLSFLYGNFISLTNLKDSDFQRIFNWHLSPLYVSVHTTDPELRKSMLRNRYADRILEQLKILVEHGITVHAQVVLCPGINDGRYLEQTIKDLENLGPNLASVGIVPVGLTRYRQNLFPLSRYTKLKARECINQVKNWQVEFYAKRGSRFVFLADEFFLMAEEEFPPAEAYEDFPQLENGVGMASLFLDEFNNLSVRFPSSLDVSEQVVVITGKSGNTVLERVIPKFEQIDKLKVDLLPVTNTFFGEEITVTGLLTGQDIYRALSEWLEKNVKSNYKKAEDAFYHFRVLIPDVMLKAETDLFLDDWTVKDLERYLEVQIKVVPTSARGLIEGVLGKKLIQRRRFRRSLII